MRGQDAKLIGKSIRARRIQQEHTQEELAEHVGISRKRLSAIESGSLGTVSALIRVTDALGMRLLAAPREVREARDLEDFLVRQAEAVGASRVKRS